MMTWEHWKQVDAWLKDLWPKQPWPDESLGRVKTELGSDVSEDDVWTYLLSFPATSPKFPPQPAEVISGVRAVTRRRLKEEADAVPVLEAGTEGGLAAYLEGIGASSFAEAVAIERRARDAGVWVKRKHKDDPDPYRHNIGAYELYTEEVRSGS